MCKLCSNDKEEVRVEREYMLRFANDLRSFASKIENLLFVQPHSREASNLNLDISARTLLKRIIEYI